MSYQSAPYWWLTCDAPGCGADSIDRDDEGYLWPDKGAAEDDARDSMDWVIAGGRHYCENHRGYVCGECDKTEGREYPLEHDGMCDDCWGGAA